MWRLNPHHVMEPEECVDSVRLRLGCAGPCEPVPVCLPERVPQHGATVGNATRTQRGHYVGTVL